MKKLVIVAMVAAFVLSSSMVMAAKSVKCKIDSIEGDKVTLTCKNIGKLKAGQKVKVKADKKKAYEGC